MKNNVTNNTTNSNSRNSNTHKQIVFNIMIGKKQDTNK